MFNDLKLETYLYIDLITETVDYVYSRYLTNNILNEAYIPLNITANNFKASILTALYEYKHLTDMTQDKLLEILNKKFERLSISFEKSNELKCKYPMSGIVRADCYNTGDIVIQVNQTFFNILENTKIDGTPTTKLNQVVEDLYTLYSHEYTHKYQFNVGNNNLKGLNINNLTNTEETKKYLSNSQEIDAHAREAAVELLLSGMSLFDIKALFTNPKNNEKLANMSKAFGKYWYLFANKPNSFIKIKPEDNKTFNSFKSSTYNFLNLDANNVSKKDLISLIRNKPE